MANKYLFVLALIIIHTTAKSYLFGATYANTVQYIQYNKYVPKKKEKKEKSGQPRDDEEISAGYFMSFVFFFCSLFSFFFADWNIKMLDGKFIHNVSR